MTNDYISIFCDGGSRGNPGPAASAFLVYDSNKSLIHSQGFSLGVTTNNQAEYQAVLESLKWLTSAIQPSNHPAINFYLDSELVVKQLTGLYKIKDQTLQKKHAEIKKILGQLEQLDKLEIRFTHIPREQNSAADQLVNQTLDASTS